MVENQIRGSIYAARSESVIMAAPTVDSAPFPAWRLQHLGRAATLPESHLGAGFASWTNVPRMPCEDPLIADQLRFGRRVLTGPTSAPALEPFPDAGKRIVGPHISMGQPEGKRRFPALVGARSTDEPPARGLKRVESRARRDTPSGANPNDLVADSKFKPESVKMFDGKNQVQYRAWLPGELVRSEYGDWNWNSRLGMRKVKMMQSGEPKRSESHPVAFPGYNGYPPDRQAGTGTRIDYALKVHGGQFAAKPPMHPDVARSRASRAAASILGTEGNQPGGLYKRGIY